LLGPFALVLSGICPENKGLARPETSKHSEHLMFVRIDGKSHTVVNLKKEVGKVSWQATAFWK
jgi:hypothetical protein